MLGSATTTCSAQKPPFIPHIHTYRKHEVSDFAARFGPFDRPLCRIVGGQLLSLRSEDQGHSGLRLKWCHLQKSLRVRVQPKGL
uniref:RH55703p n=1 Tax=Drosophila melanogaster TaxID=7227 RepID=D9PTV5_DROME|nr:RH55703p [Drosophila melanogaster]